MLQHLVGGEQADTLKVDQVIPFYYLSIIMYFHAQKVNVTPNNDVYVYCM